MTKRKMIRILLLILAVIICLTGCAQTGENTGTRSTAENTTASEVKETAPATEETAAPAKKTASPEKETAPPEEETAAPEKEAGPIIEPQEIADYLFEHGELPDNFITKKEAQALGWNSSRNYLSDVAPGKSIGGDKFGNYEKVLPVVKGRKYYEADCRYTGGKRGSERIIWSSDGHVWYTGDHYNTFTELFPSRQEE